MEEKDIYLSAFEIKYPEYKGKVVFTDHFIKRLKERFSGKLSQGLMRVIIKGVKELDYSEKSTIESSSHKFLVPMTNENSHDNKVIIKTVKFNNIHLMCQKDSGKAQEWAKL